MFFVVSEWAFVRCGVMILLLTTCFFSQVGDGSWTHRRTPVGVSGLSSGIVVVATGQVRLFVIASLPLIMRMGPMCFPNVNVVIEN